MSDKQDLNYCTYCGSDIPLQYTIDVSLETKARVDGESIGYITDNYSLCSYKCLHEVLSSQTDFYNVSEKVEEFKEEIANRHYRIKPVSEENGGDKE